MAAEKQPGTGGPLGAGLFCNLPSCLVYLSFSPPFSESSAFYFQKHCILFSGRGERDRVVASEREGRQMINSPYGTGELCLGRVSEAKCQNPLSFE
jgi:hypothetical protein